VEIREQFLHITCLQTSHSYPEDSTESPHSLHWRGDENVVGRKMWLEYLAEESFNDPGRAASARNPGCERNIDFSGGREISEVLLASGGGVFFLFGHSFLPPHLWHLRLLIQAPHICSLQTSQWKSSIEFSSRQQLHNFEIVIEEEACEEEEGDAATTGVGG
jgi:hypothetical protein